MTSEDSRRMIAENNAWQLKENERVGKGPSREKQQEIHEAIMAGELDIGPKADHYLDEIKDTRDLRDPAYLGRWIKSRTELTEDSTSSIADDAARADIPDYRHDETSTKVTVETYQTELRNAVFSDIPGLGKLDSDSLNALRALRDKFPAKFARVCDTLSLVHGIDIGKDWDGMPVTRALKTLADARRCPTCKRVVPEVGGAFCSSICLMKFGAVRELESMGSPDLRQFDHEDDEAIDR